MAKHQHSLTAGLNLLSGKITRFFILFLFLSLCNQCDKETPSILDHNLLDLQDQQNRVEYLQQDLHFERFGSLKGTAVDYTFTVVATIAPPTITGTPIQACNLYSDGSKIYVAYNLAGDGYKGAVDIYTYTLDPVNTVLTAASSMEFSNSDINGVAAIPDGADGYEVFLVGSTQGYTASALASPAFLIYFDPTLTTYDVVDIPGYTATSIGYDTGADWFSVSSGSNGGITILDRPTLTAGLYVPKTNLTSVFCAGDFVYQVVTDPCSLDVYQKIASTDASYDLTGYTADIMQKSSVQVKYGHSFLALNEGGTAIFNNTTNNIVESLTPANPGGVPAEYLVSNGLCVGDYRLFIANGGGGLSVAELDLDMNINVIGNVLTNQSVNHVVMLLEGGNSGYLAMVSGKAGLKIVYYTYSGTVPTITTTLPNTITLTSAESGGEITDDGGTVVSARGVSWNTTGNPTIADDHTSEGTGTGSFSSSITGLSVSTTYYVRAYAINNVGIEYGNEESFTTLWECGYPYIDARDGNSYGTVDINGQCWMAKNLAFLPSVSPSSEGSDTDPYFYVYGYEGSNVAEASDEPNYGIYGVLYNWPAAMYGEGGSDLIPSGVQGICPDDWHLPSYLEWDMLRSFLGSNGGGNSKEIGTAHWLSPNEGATNSTGFTALPAGSRWGTKFDELSTLGGFWSSSEYLSYSIMVYLKYDRDYWDSYGSFRRNAISVRCLKD